MSLPFAWQWRTDINNWNDPPAEFTLDGPFVEGTQGTTRLPGRDPLPWIICSVQPNESFVIKMPLSGATLSFEWLFEALTERRTRMTQRVVLRGDHASTYTQQVESAFGSNLAAGMARIAADLTRAAHSSGFGGATPDP